MLAFALVLAISLSGIATAALGGGGVGRARFSWEAVADPIVSGYKVYWGSASGVYSHSFDAGNVTEVIIASFAEGGEYFSAVTAYSVTGEESGYSEEVPFIYDTTDRVLLLEAENGVLTAPMSVFSDASNSWVAASTTDPTAATTLDFNAPYASDFYVWCRVLAPSASADSMFVMVDQQAELVYDIYGEPTPPAAIYQAGWTWSRIQVSPGTARAFALEGGSHSIRFRYRENTWLDRVVIVSSPDFVPTDALPRSGDFVEFVNQPQDSSVAAGGSVTFSATMVATGPLNVQWFHDGIPVPESSQMSLSLSNVQASAGGSYTLTASRNSAIITSQPVTLTVVPPVVTVVPPVIIPSPVFSIRKLTIARAGQITFDIEGALGTEIGVYASSDLVNWCLVVTCANNGNTFTITDPGAIGVTKRFYQLRDLGRP
jgi:hypothetical protein